MLFWNVGFQTIDIVIKRLFVFKTKYQTNICILNVCLLTIRRLYEKYKFPIHVCVHKHMNPATAESLVICNYDLFV